MLTGLPPFWITVHVVAGKSRRIDLDQLSLIVTEVLQVVSHLRGKGSDQTDQTDQPDPALLRRAVRQTLDLLAQRAPGHAVEVRVPPYAAVQCVAGPRHSRGTPSNVVETDAVTWLELAAGTLSWADATAARRLSASGERADLSAHLPLLPDAAAGRIGSLP
jgi:hypothetical protein